MRSKVSVAWGCLISLVILRGLSAAPPPVPVSQLAVDHIHLKSGRLLRGAVLRDSNGSLTMAVSREWLEAAQPDNYQQASARNAELRKQALEQLRGRLKKELNVPPAEPRLVFFLKQELERVEDLLASAKPTESQFLWLDLDQATIAKVTRAPADRQRIAMWAWSERLSNVETRDAQGLQRELQQRKIEPSAAPPDLSDRLVPRMQDDREWAARMAILEYTLVKSIDFQGTGSLLVRTDVERKLADLAPVLTKVLQSQVDSILKDLTGDGRADAPVSDAEWLKPATREAEGASARGLRATRVEIKVDGNTAEVQTVFAARFPNGTWEIVWSHRESQDARKPRADLEAKIADDPQIKQALEAIKSFGLGADDQVRQAIRFGAATMSAQQSADTRFFEFRDRHVKHLDGPPLIWSK